MNEACSTNKQMKNTYNSFIKKTKKKNHLGRDDDDDKWSSENRM
jgi:hypothetical protein